jgi:hypothetical protein
MGFSLQGKVRKIAVLVRRLTLPLVFAFMFTLFGLFDGVGFHLYYIGQVSFVPHDQLGYADATFTVNMVYNPIVYPLYWVMGKGYVNGTFRMMYVPESYAPGEFGGPMWGMTPQDRYDEYILYMVTWGTLLNLVFLLAITVIIDFAGYRSLYLVLLFGVFGFYTFQIIGMLMGIAAGSMVALLLFKWRPDNSIVRLWHSLWEPDLK